MSSQTLILSLQDVQQLLNVKTCIELQEKAFRWYGQGKAMNAPNTWLDLPSYHGWMKLMGGVNESEDRFAAKITARFPELPLGNNLQGIIVLFNAQDGTILSIMDGIYISAIRTGAGGGLAARYLAREDSEVMGVLGTGIQARFNVAAIQLNVPSIKRIVAYSRSSQNRAKFVEDMQKVGIEVLTIDQPEEVIKEADVLVTATNSTEPDLTADQVKPGMYICMVGYKKEIAPEVFRGSKIVVDSRDLALKDGKIAEAIQLGILDDQSIYAELSEIVIGTQPGRTKAEEVTIFDSSGLAVQDCATANYVYQRALEKGMGVAVDLGADQVPTLGEVFTQ